MNYGLAEAVLYSMRLYDVVVKSLDDEALNTKSEDAMSLVLSSLSYDGDAIGRLLPQFYFSLESVRIAIIHKIGDLQQQQQQLLQKYHGLKDTYLRENFATVKPNACAIFLDQDMSSIVDMYGTISHFTAASVVPKFEYLRTLDASDDVEGYSYSDGSSESDEHALLVTKERDETGVPGAGMTDSDNEGDNVGAAGAAGDLTDAEVDALMALGDTDAPAGIVNDNCFQADGSRLEASLYYLLNREKGLHDRDEEKRRGGERRETELAARAIGYTVQTTSECG